MKTKRLLLAIATLVICPMVTFAYVIPSSHTFTATVTPTGGIQTWNAVLKNVSDNSSTGVTQIAWTGVSAGQVGYKVANQYIAISVNITNIVNWRMTLYTNNSDYLGAKSSNTTTGFGLVGQGDKHYGLPLAWMVLDVTTATPATPVFSTNRSNGTQGFTNFMWKFVQDKNLLAANGTTKIFNAADTYVRVWDNAGFYWNESAGAGFVSPSSDNNILLYLATDFTHSLAQTYSTNSLTLDVTSF